MTSLQQALLMWIILIAILWSGLYFVAGLISKNLAKKFLSLTKNTTTRSLTFLGRKLGDLLVYLGGICRRNPLGSAVFIILLLFIVFLAVTNAR